MSDRVCTLTNVRMESMLGDLEPLLDRDDLIGYAAGRNTRVIKQTILDYLENRDRLVRERGEPVLDESGKETGQYRISRDDGELDRFIEELRVYGDIEHEVRIVSVPASEAVGRLTGRQVEALGWMLEED